MQVKNIIFLIIIWNKIHPQPHFYVYKQQTLSDHLARPAMSVR